MSSEILISIIGFVTTISSSTLSWTLAKRKYHAEVDNSLIANMKESLDFYKAITTDNKERLDNMLERTDRLERENAELKGKILDLMGSICLDLSCQLRKRESTTETTKKNGTKTKKAQ